MQQVQGKGSVEIKGPQSSILCVTEGQNAAHELRRSVKVVERANTALPGSPQTQSIAKITIESINLKVPHLTPNDDIKLQLLTRIKADESMMIPFRRWELHELPALTQGSTIEIWSVKTCSALDSPRYVIVFFQTKKADNLHEDVTLFDNANIKSIRLALNSDYYPQERMLLDFSRDQYADAHFNYTEFNKSYHNCQEKRSLVNFAEFKSRPMFVIDCSRRHLGLKSSTVDIKSQTTHPTLMNKQTEYSFNHTPDTEKKSNFKRQTFNPKKKTWNHRLNQSKKSEYEYD
ncbi:unnamed protein product [Phaedon cochleariae]|uniref:Double jelly roll-like domain-containing protein n=1 Tax=Phaedon cochleariae TaxID=80249 RepID=A0A9N9SI67_PHACE|nr:unnamed protein product [Phaedon cochleariae]